jgi:hypothetical protein
MQKAIKRARSIGELFELVQKAVRQSLDVEHAGLLVGLSDLGAEGYGFIGAFYSPEANTIVINTRPLEQLSRKRPELYNPYVFHLMLHEYIHAIGCYDESEARVLVEQVSRETFGPSHAVTRFATNMEEFLPELSHPGAEFQPPEELAIDFVMGIDRKNTNYIN